MPEFKPEDLRNAILAAIPEAEVEVKDTAGDGNHFQANVTAEEFIGKSLIEQHKMVYRALEGMDVHALGLKTCTP